MNQAMQRFVDYLDQKGVKYRLHDDKSLTVPYRGDNAPNINVMLIFGEDCCDVAVKIFTICKVPDNKVYDMYKCASELNAHFRWLKFYIDKDQELMADMDAVIQIFSCAEECYELVQRSVSIVDDAYPMAMKVLYS